MYQLTDHDNWFLGRLHEHLDHDCSLTSKGFCSIWEGLEVAYLEAKNEEQKKLQVYSHKGDL